MPFPGTYGTALSTILTGQANANQDRAAYNAQIQQRQLEEQLKRAQLMMQLQDASEQRKLLSGLPQDEQTYLKLGGSISDYTKRGERSTKANALADQYYQQSLDPNLPMDQRLRAANLAAQYRAHPELVDEAAQLGKGIGEKGPRGFLLVDKDTGLPWQGQGQAPDNYIPVSEYNNLHNPSRETPVQKFGDTPIGALKGQTMLKTSGEPFTDPRMTVDEAIAEGGALMTNDAAKRFGSSVSAERNLDTLDQAGKQVLPANVPTGFGETLRDITVNPARRAILARVDPRYAAYEHSKAGIITYVRELAKAGRINQAELDIIVDRLNNAQTYPALQSAVGTAREIIQQDRASLTQAGKLSPSAGNSSLRTPVYVGGKLVGYTTDGKTMEPVP